MIAILSFKKITVNTEQSSQKLTADRKRINITHNKVTSLVRPKLFLFSAGLIVCATSLFLNVRLAERMGQLQDNDMKYRYLLMQGQADGNTLERLENKFKWQRDERFIRNLTDSVLDFEERCRRQAEALERAKLLNEQAEQLKKEADRLENQ